MNNESGLSPDKHYTYADYLTWPDDKRRELVNGFIRMMSPAPSLQHQEIAGVLYIDLYRLIERNGGKCKVFHAPFDVRLPRNGERENDQIHTVVQPDICVVCDLSKLDKRGCLGAPDLVVEIQSLSTARYDLTDKFNLYEASGVREYWVVFPDDGVEVFILQPDGKYDRGTGYDCGKIPVHIFDGAELDLDKVFKNC
ncbi:MAG: Uma2 family endonuclease [Tannerella sp.]|jgi:Uma2 family endonuclease|nr:Uma2 family endonuclease [Tannerella sp.]